MDWIWPVLESPFTWGLAFGLLIAGFVAKSAFTARGHSRREIARLKSEIEDLQRHINTHLKITATGSERLEKELVALKEQNENLRVNFAALQHKPGRAEARQLQACESALARMREQIPGFAPAWERALREATAELENAESGLARLARKILPGGLGTAPASDSTPMISSGDSSKP